MSTKKLAIIGVLCGLGMIANLFISFPIIPAASFLSYDPKDIVIIMGGFIYGPLSAALMSFVCSILEIMFRGGNLIDVLMNVISTCAIACTAAVFYQIDHSRKGAIKGLIVGVILSTVLMVIWNYIVTPIYYGWPREAVVELIIPGIIPFNLLKGAINAVITIYLYKPFVSILRHNHLALREDKIGNKELKAILIFCLITLTCVVLANGGII